MEKVGSILLSLESNERIWDKTGLREGDEDMLKLDQSDDYIMEIMRERFEISSELLFNEYVQNKDRIDQEYQQVFHDLFLRCIAMQKEGKKEKIAVISIFYLRTQPLKIAHRVLAL